MSVFTTVTHQALATWLADYDVGTLTDLRGIASGIENTNYFASTTQGQFVLTLFEKLSASELPFYLNLMAHLAQHGVPRARPIANRTGAYLGTLHQKPAALVARLSGADVSHPSSPQCAAVGAALAHLHLAGHSYPATMPNPRAHTWWHTVLPNLLPFLSTAVAATLRAEIQYQDGVQQQHLPQGAIHADLFRDNVLLEGDQVAGIIDFYFACTGAWLYDVAIAVNDWCIDTNGALDPARYQAFITSYHSERPFIASEYLAWPALLRAAALRFWVSRLYDLHLPRAGALTHAKDPGHFANILQLRRDYCPPLPQ